MSTFRTPVGPQPSGVYWRRRLLVVLGILAVIIAIVLIVVGPGLAGQGGKKNVAETPAPTTTSKPPVDNSDPSQACSPKKITVEAITDKASYKAGEQPMLSLSITNTGTASCTFQAGADVQVYTITSGKDEIWSSQDCQAKADPTPTVLKPGTAVSTTPFPWDRTRSSSDTCEGERAAVTGGGATYRLTATVDGVKAAADKPFLLY
ncbi:MAG: hypothetical protein ACOH1T_12400 [Microbacteriaceae bacterium]